MLSYCFQIVVIILSRINLIDSFYAALVLCVVESEFRIHKRQWWFRSSSCKKTTYHFSSWWKPPGKSNEKVFESVASLIQLGHGGVSILTSVFFFFVFSFSCLGIFRHNRSFGIPRISLHVELHYWQSFRRALLFLNETNVRTVWNSLGSVIRLVDANHVIKLSPKNNSERPVIDFPITFENPLGAAVLFSMCFVHVFTYIHGRVEPFKNK